MARLLAVAFDTSAAGQIAVAAAEDQCIFVYSPGLVPRNQLIDRMLLAERKQTLKIEMMAEIDGDKMIDSNHDDGQAGLVAGVGFQVVYIDWKP